MLPKIFEFGLDFFAVLFCALSVKLADDFLDKTSDASIGKYNLTQLFGEGTMLYAMFFLAVGAGLNHKLSLALFFACYIVGMFNQMSFIFPSRLKGFHESLIVCSLGVLLFGVNYMLFSLCFIVAVQLFDDYADLRQDKQAGQNNFANRFGELECILLSLIFFFSAGALDSSLILPVSAAFLIVYLALSLWVRRKTPRQ